MKFVCQTSSVVRRSSTGAPSIKQIAGLFLIAIAARVIAAGLRRMDRAPWAAAGWALGGIGSWLAATAAGAWTPYWVGLLPAAPAFIAGRLGRERGVAPIADAVAVLLVGFASHPPVAWPALLGVALAFALVGVIADAVVWPSNEWAPYAAGGAAIVTSVSIFTFDAPASFVHYVQKNPKVLVNLGLARRTPAEKIILKNGAVAWLDRHAGDSRGAAVFFHGYHYQGANQPASMAIRRALMEAGFAVLSVDRPGFGGSPAPNVDAPLNEWDPLPGDLDAIARMEGRAGPGNVLVVGHSVGCSEVTRVLATGVPIRGAVMLGAGYVEGSRPHYWHKRFNRIFKFEPEMPFERWQVIEQAHFEKGMLLRRLQPDHAPVLFVDFEIENPDVEASRGHFYEMIPGPKTKVLTRGSHYLNSERIDSLLVGDPGPTGALAELFKRSFKVLDSLRAPQ